MLASIIGTLAALLTTLAFLPQVRQTLKTKNTSGISLGMYSIFTLGVFLWLLYGIMMVAWPIIIANTLTLALASTVLALKLKHG
ncbi:MULTISPECIES: SemiSWEET transporter [unclassified Hahella]|uniref:SemiSWEET transporter n=1 Tax=unclassified Hahella TaxID=2624107 RepID=UPI000FDDC539|nr:MULTISPECIES: SemiSWEET transporter [unclassified Hahella]AZZ94818.1 hypothetical protein ENC22_27940 [Hahella sp. KA22]MBU6952696.1 SemiSWEET transporter [Hahella sp. HN01]MDG9667055.1 SemiSWEET transporter [Hahella sp. CR1]QAY58192.1 hypothetical protein EUZ85_30525 [Hahella sp. KA22]WLQ13669.1 SemiSWEET transporter [Hahella sp. HNIBRBA332]